MAETADGLCNICAFPFLLSNKSSALFTVVQQKRLNVLCYVSRRMQLGGSYLTEFWQKSLGQKNISHFHSAINLYN